MKPFETMVPVRFGHVDPAGIVYFPRIYDYLHDVFEELWEYHVRQPYYHLLLERGIGFPLVRAEAEFTHPLRFGDRAIVRVTCFHLGRSSLGLRYLVSVADEVCVEARLTTVCVELENMRSIPVPPEFRSRFEELEEAP